MNQQSRSVIAATLVSLFIATSVAASIETTTLPSNHKAPVDTSSTNLKLEARSEEIELPEKSESPTQIPKVYPVYPEYKSNTEKQAVKPTGNWKSVKPSSQDSYLNALEYSHTSKHQRDNIPRFEKPKGVIKLIRRNYDGPVYRPSNEYGAPNAVSPPAKTPRIIYGAGPTAEPFIPTPSNSYSLPNDQPTVNFGQQNAYGNGYPPAVQNQYGPPSQSYGVSQTGYGPPQHIYQAPAQSQQGWNGYALSQAPQLPELPSLPSFDFAWPFALKLNAFTIAKILLKLVIFKMIVKFIAVICLLLFIPKLEIKSDKDNMEDDEGRKLVTSDSTLERLNILTTMVHEAIEKYEKANGDVNDEECTTVSCRMRRFLGSGDSWNDYIKLFKSYAAEEKTIHENRIET